MNDFCSTVPYHDAKTNVSHLLYDQNYSSVTQQGDITTTPCHSIGVHMYTEKPHLSGPHLSVIFTYRYAR